MIVAGYFIAVGTCYSAIGCVVAVAFLVFGVGRIDESARGVYAFRLLLIPGLVLLWPLVILRWLAIERQPFSPDQKDGHS